MDPIENSPRRGPTARYERILEAAEESFSRFGFKKTTVDEISQRARVSKALVYKHFNGKEQIFEAVVTRVVNEWSAALSKGIEAAGPHSRDRLAAMHRATMALAARPGLAELVGRGAQEVLSGWSSVIEVATVAWKDEIETILRDGIESGEIRNDLQVEAMADVVGELTLAYGNRVVLDSDNADLREFEGTAVSVMLDGVSVQAPR